MEVNSRPELKDDIIDKTVNRPMVGRLFCFEFRIFTWISQLCLITLLRFLIHFIFSVGRNDQSHRLSHSKILR